MSNEQERFMEIVKSFRHLMLVTNTQHGARGRPMRVSSVDPDGSIWFITSIVSGKVDELVSEPGVAVVGQRDGRYLSITGVAEIVRDRSRINALWTAEDNAWFKLGKQDPEAVAVHMVPIEAEYWDRSGTSVIRQLYELATGSLPGKRASAEELQEHEKFQL